MTAYSKLVSPEKRFHRWVVEFEVKNTWVEDGFDLTDARALRILSEVLPFAYGHELRARVLERPPDVDVAHAQGMTVGEYLADRERDS